MNINIKLLDDRAQLPVYATSGAGCFDISCIEGADIAPGDSHNFSTGLAFEIPDGHVMLVFSRSGHGFKHDTRLSNAVGVIDSDYTGILRVKLRNDGNSTVAIAAGDRIAQGLIMPVFAVGFTRVNELKETERGDKGFGSTDL
jgi:dUTP pyrophosphatase